MCIPASSEQPDPSDASADVPDGAVEADVNDMESFDAGVPKQIKEWIQTLKFTSRPNRSCAG